MGTIVAEVMDNGEKRASRGRRLTAADRRAEVVRAYRASGLTMAGFARRERIKYSTFAGWVWKAAKAPMPLTCSHHYVRTPPSEPSYHASLTRHCVGRLLANAMIFRIAGWELRVGPHPAMILLTSRFGK
jgi:hypothetical protein